MTNAGLRAADFDFALPAGCIAQAPARPRDAARLLHVGVALSDRTMRDLPGLLRAGDIVVGNDTRVIPAQLAARRGAARIGITLDQPTADGGWRALVRNARRLRVGDVLAIEDGNGVEATVRECAGGGAVLDFDRAGADFEQALRRCGALALPPYIERPDGPLASDVADYQTVFARNDGAVAAPTAGLHFTPALLNALAAAGVLLARVTLHVGAGTFLPMREDAVAAHRMHSERGCIDAATAAAINAARQAGGRIVAVGTTTLRLLEAATDADGVVHPYRDSTDIFILPGHQFRSANLLLTNFHLPRSTLFMLVCAFSGTVRMRAAYAHAIDAGYRFYSYGDASLLERA